MIEKVVAVGLYDEFIGTVVHRTPKGTVDVDFDEYRKTVRFTRPRIRGRSIHLQAATPERIQGVFDAKESARLARRCRETFWRDIPLPILRQVAALIGDGE